MSENPFSHRAPRSWRKITIVVAAKHADITANFLAALSGSGVEFAATNNINEPRPTESISAYFVLDSTLSKKKNKLKKFLLNLYDQEADNGPQLHEEDIQEEDWCTLWKKDLKPVRITEHIVVKPSWEKYEPCDREIIIEIDPGMAFGTGLHASTRMSLEFIDECFTGKTPNYVLDVGTGTGILGIACALLGARTVLGIDNDPDAVATARENIRHNRIEGLMSADNTDLGKITGPFELISANITHDILLELAPALTALLAPGATLILAGILQGRQAASIENRYCGLGLKLKGRRNSEEWTALRFES